MPAPSDLLQILGGLLIAALGVLVIRGLQRHRPRSGFLFGLGRLLRRIAGLFIFLIGLGVALEATPFMSVRICLDFNDDVEWCAGSGKDDGEADEMQPLDDGLPDPQPASEDTTEKGE